MRIIYEYGAEKQRNKFVTVDSMSRCVNLEVTHSSFCRSIGFYHFAKKSAKQHRTQQERLFSAARWQNILLPMSAKYMFEIKTGVHIQEKHIFITPILLLLTSHDLVEESGDSHLNYPNFKNIDREEQ